MTTPARKPGSDPHKPAPARRAPTDKLELKQAQEVIQGTGKLTLPSVDLDDIEIPGL